MTIKFHEDADEELSASIEFYEEQYKGLGIKFYREIRKSVSLISASPNIWPKKHGECRRYLIDNFPFSIHYLIRQDTLWIVAVAHTSKRPFYWKERL